MIKEIQDLNTIEELRDHMREVLKRVEEICIPEHNDIISIVQTAINRLNIQYGGLLEDSGGGKINKAIEEEIVKIHNRFKPSLGCFHPADRLAMADIQSQVYPRYGCEIKVCTGWGKNKQIEWRNGTVQTSTENFLFIYAPIENGIIILKNIWFGRFSYNEWLPHYTNVEHTSCDLRICRKQIKNKCKQLL